MTTTIFNLDNSTKQLLNRQRKLYKLFSIQVYLCSSDCSDFDDDTGDDAKSARTDDNKK